MKRADEETTMHDEAYKRACAKLWQAFAAYQEWQQDQGDVETFADWVKEDLPGLMPVDGG